MKKRPGILFWNCRSGPTKNKLKMFMPTPRRKLFWDKNLFFNSKPVWRRQLYFFLTKNIIWFFCVAGKLFRCKLKETKPYVDKFGRKFGQIFVNRFAADKWLNCWFPRLKISYLINGQWLWHSWQRGCFRFVRTRVRILSSATLIEHIYC